MTLLDLTLASHWANGRRGTERGEDSGGECSRDRALLMTCEADRRRTTCMPTTPVCEVEVRGQIGPWSHRIEPTHQHAPRRFHVLRRILFPGFSSAWTRGLSAPERDRSAGSRWSGMSAPSPTMAHRTRRLAPQASIGSRYREHSIEWRHLYRRRRHRLGTWIGLLFNSSYAERSLSDISR